MCPGQLVGRLRVGLARVDAIQIGAARGGESIISATFWDVEPLGHNWGVQTVGLVKLDDTPEAP